MTPGPLLVANLDVEDVWRRGAQDDATSASPPRAMRRRMAEYGSLLRALALPGSALWIADALEPTRLPALPGIPASRLLSGPLTIDRGHAGIAWGMGPGQASLVAPDAEACDALPPLTRALWTAPRIDAEAAARWNHDATLRELHDRVLPNLPTPGAWATDEAGVDAAMDALGERPVLVKAPLTASGRDRLVVEVAARSAPHTRTRIARLLAYGGGVSVLPWRTRVRDLAATAVLLDTGPSCLATHELHNRPGGQFESTRFPLREGRESAGEEDDLAHAFSGHAARILERLHAAGVRGPIGIDGYVFEEAGRRHLEPLCDLNVRLTMGLLMRVLVERMAPALPACETPPSFELRMGPRSRDEGDVRAVPLLRPDPTTAGTSEAWLLRTEVRDTGKRAEVTSTE